MKNILKWFYYGRSWDQNPWEKFANTYLPGSKEGNVIGIMKLIGY